MGLEPTNLLRATQALYQLSYAPEGNSHSTVVRVGTSQGARGSADTLTGS